MLTLESVCRRWSQYVDVGVSMLTLESRMLTLKSVC